MSALRILVVGSGGREHALAWRLATSPSVETVYIAPGNGGTGSSAKLQNVAIGTEDFKALVEFAVKNDIGLVLPGPEQPLVDGIESHFRKVGIPVFGPSSLAARMEGSKAFSKDFMARHSIPTATYKVFTSQQYSEALQYTQTCGHRVVLKASGLAAGKGVLIPETPEEVEKGLQDILLDQVFGDAGNEVVIEEYLTGPEISVLAFSDGFTIVPLPAAQDHKRIGEGDTGLNTGGMGAYAPAPVATQEVISRITNEVLRPTIDGMRKEGYPFVGLLFTGFILTESGPRVLEYNVRFGDPETEALMLLLSDDTDLAAVLLACAERHLDSVPITTKPGFAVSVILASQGYPGSYSKGKAITIGELPEGVSIFHAGTAIKGGQLVTAGGRVLAVCAYGQTIEQALNAAYKGVDEVNFEGMTYRRDIAHRALKASSGGKGHEPLTYAQAGVSVDAGNYLVETIKPFIKQTRRPGADGTIGGFGGVFDLKAAGWSEDSLLVAGTDGVGTKLRVALEVGKHDTVGIDLVAMSVNDLIVQGAEPLLFLDYYGTSKLDVKVAAEVIKGIADGCIQAGCALVGGETAEMPGMYAEGDYDLAGFAVGAVRRSHLLPKPDTMQAGDVLLGLSSSGLHSNGFSLVRKIVQRAGLTFSSPCPWWTRAVPVPGAPPSPPPPSASTVRGQGQWGEAPTVGEALLVPTTIYVKQLLPLCQSAGQQPQPQPESESEYSEKTLLLKGLVHITGGGFIENVPRILPGGLTAEIDVAAWALPPVFRWLMQEGNVQPAEMARTFNCGIGMVLVVAPEHVDQVVRLLDRSAGSVGGGAAVHKIGRLVQGTSVQLKRLETWGA